ncbi:unnamed protein product [Urochloa decumbens]|uniref:Reverse transcriptase domain-containing protein n=1 Tax=Urochloa decumbens TaxID=240449 RepID=A0ABC8W5R6_9POAL
MLYADDTLVLVRAEEGQVRRLKHLLNTFAAATGLVINYHKSTFVPIHVDPSRAAELAAVLGCPVATFPQSYLGLPLSNKKLPAAVLDALAVKVERCIPSWRVHLPNRGGRLTLVNTVLTAQLTYAAAALLLPKPTIEKVDKPRRGMLWKGATTCSGGDCQVAWVAVWRLKDEGGLGVTDIEVQNTCLLLKTVDKLQQGHDNPWANWVRFWYTPERTATPTPCWKMIQGLLPLYRGVTTVVLSSGVTTSFWYDNWTSVGPLHRALPALFSHCLAPDATVAAAFSTGRLVLPLQDRLSPAAQDELAGLTTRLHGLRLGNHADGRQLAWGDCLDVRSGALYTMLMRSGRAIPDSEINWTNFAPIKVRVFFWIFRHGNTRTRAFMHGHGALNTADCPFCTGQTEDVTHLFFACPRIAHFWHRACPGAPVSSVVSLLQAIPLPAGELLHSAVLLLLWVIWKSRNRMIFDAVNQDEANIARTAREHLALWVHRARRRTDTTAIETWCSSLCVN